MNSPKIYVACLSSYNNGILHGEWIDVEDYEQLQEEVNRILKESPMNDAEEWAIHDFEGFGNIKIEEYDGLEHVAELAEALVNLNETETTVFEYLYDNYDLEDAVEKMEEVNIFEGSRSDYAQEITEECNDVPDYLVNYIDYDRMGRDMEYNSEIVEIEHDVFITNAYDL